MAAKVTYRQLRREVQALAKNVRKGAEQIRQRTTVIDAAAKDTGKVAEQIGRMGVAQATIAETAELAKIMAGLSKAVIAYAVSTDTTAKAAKAVDDQAKASHEGIQQAMNRSPDAAKDTRWYQQQ
ncbi:hypothetical protein [Streptomyces violascens]|uniref:hypothetical protein n=1 Tax=Streptomyces violascens TaxID=67381 RepID=UPI00167ACFE6|nr:hypothetical protein [Streptomyces violascens]GGU49822.1 hypothetical protein GCM10010289_82870 [Streptomyces violascens]